MPLLGSFFRGLRMTIFDLDRQQYPSYYVSTAASCQLLAVSTKESLMDIVFTLGNMNYGLIDNVDLSW
jgi:hypothetical protein